MLYTRLHFPWGFDSEMKFPPVHFRTTYRNEATMSRPLGRSLLLIFLLHLALSACTDEFAVPADPETRIYSMAEFVGQWETTLPNGEKWLMVLHEDGRFDSIPIQSPRGKSSGRWNLKKRTLVWEYPGTGSNGTKSEINPIILKTEDKFMLQERMGMKSIFWRKD
jgi:hypothetical protein